MYAHRPHSYFSLVIVLFLAGPGCADPPAPIEGYVTPFYHFDGPQINVGNFSEELASADRKAIRDVAAAMGNENDSLPVVAMYVAAIRLYDLGHHDAAVQWFYAAQYRARLFQALLDESKVGGIGSVAFELKSAHSAFYQLIGPYINGYAGCDKEQWLAVLENLRAEKSRSLPNLAAIYPSINFIPEDQWAVKNLEVAQGLEDLAEHLDSEWPNIKAARAQEGIDRRFCGW